jgi:hypothetical protein
MGGVLPAADPVRLKSGWGGHSLGSILVPVAIGWPIRRAGILMIVAAAALAGCTAGAGTVSTGVSAPPAPSSAVGTSSPTPVTGATGPGTTHPLAGTTVAPAPTTTAAGPETVAPVSISLSSADFGRTVHLRLRDSVQVTLEDAGMRWSSLTVSPVGPLRPDPAPAPPPNGQLAIWTAVQPGTVTVSATGTAGCTPPRACPLFARLFQVTIVIS